MRPNWIVSTLDFNCRLSLKCITKANNSNYWVCDRYSAPLFCSFSLLGVSFIWRRKQFSSADQSLSYSTKVIIVFFISAYAMGICFFNLKMKTEVETLTVEFLTFIQFTEQIHRLKAFRPTSWRLPTSEQIRKLCKLKWKCAKVLLLHSLLELSI